MIEEKLERVYFNFKRCAIGKEEALNRIIDTCNYFCESNASLDDIMSVLRKSMYYMDKIGNLRNDKMFKFLEGQIIAGDIDINLRSAIYSLLETYFPKKLHHINKFLLEHVRDFIEHDLYDARLNDFGLTDFLFKTFKKLSEFKPIIVFDARMNGFVSRNIFIVY